ncbi:Ntn hydrolase family protein [Natronorubrum aibiense]|uniref:proteasome endopeptidase complex n=1 Tax=Natronorubrum aibiense TaxID=348826 RepID=A0A5P9P577_9EURY|nr:proteasome subunit beta [Natronorubrum aibiense]QFU83117.1 proteasome subunit beta [Natronorubrum aibiense]
MPSRPIRLRPAHGDRYCPDGGEPGGEGGTLVGVGTTAGVVLAADTRTSRDTTVTSEASRKLESVHPTAAIGSSADLGRSRSFVHALRADVDRYENRHGRLMPLSALATVAGREHRSHSLDATVVLGGVDETGSNVFTVDGDEGVLEVDYTAEGSGRELAFGVLDRGYAETLSLKETQALVSRAIDSAVERDARTGSALAFAMVTEDGVDVRRPESTDG